MNRGILAGLRSAQFLSYDPKLVAFAYGGGGTPTQPSLGNGTAQGRYFVTPSGLVICSGLITFGSTTTFGSAEDFWGISVPVQINRSSGGADMPIGVAMGWQGLSASPQLCTPLTPTALDPGLPFGNQSQEDSYFQIFCHWCLAQGTGTIASGATTTTVTHLMPFTPMASDINLTVTNNTTNNPGQVYVTSITSTQFTVGCRSNPGASGLNFSWKVRGEPEGPHFALDGNGGLLVASNAPWVWASGHQLSWQIMYEARR
jgi:hypothetical protein